MTYDEMVEQLDAMLKDEKVVDDISAVLWKENAGESAEIFLDSQKLTVPPRTNINIVTKALFKDYYDTGFGNCKAQVAIGSVEEQHGIITAQYCFATLYYNHNLQVITIDFHESFR